MDHSHGNGILYGVGVGTGDPEMMTLKAVRIIRSADVICLPKIPKEECGTDKERIFHGAASIPTDGKYMTTIIVREIYDAEEEDDLQWGE